MQDAWRTIERIWNVVITAAMTLVAVRIPLLWVFGPPEHLLWSAVDWVLAALFVVDLFVHWRELGAKRPGHAGFRALNWRLRMWLLFDLIAAIPGPLFGGRGWWLSLPLAKLPRLARLTRQWRKRATRHGAKVRLFLFVFWLALIAHWLACGWGMLRQPLASDDPVIHYIRSLYWCVTTLATVGYGDITPNTPPEMIYSMFVMIAGVGLFGYVIGNVAHWLANIDQAHTQYQNNLERLATFLRYRRIPLELQQRIFDYYAYLWENRLVYDEFAMLAELPVPLQSEVSLALKKDFIEKVPFLRGASQQLIRDLSLELHPAVYMPGDFVFHSGEMARHIYFISRGAVEIIAADGHSILSKLHDGDFFGEIALLFHQPRSASVRATEYCNLYALDKMTFERILLHHPDFAKHVQAEAQRRRSANSDPAADSSGQLHSSSNTE